MNITTLSRTFILLRRLLDTSTSTESILPVQPQKPPAPLTGISQPFPRQTPESAGIPSEYIENFLKELAADPDLEMHNLLILRKGAVLLERSFGGQDLRLWKNTYSECKSITSLAIGLLADEGKIKVTDRVVDLLSESIPLNIRLKHKNLTVEHLLTMTSTVLFNEAEAMASSDWVKSFLSAGTAGELGKTFNYNSLNTYMLSAIVCAVSGQSLSSFLDQRLFGPMGITDYFWETCPKGIEKGGWGLYICPEDIAKLGQLVMDQGVWKGRRLISEAWIRAAVTARQTPPKDFGDYDYGYQIWVGRGCDSFLFNGMLGQNVLGFPNSGVLLVSNAGIPEMFQQSRYYEIARQYFSMNFPDHLPENASAFRRLQGGGRKIRWWSSLRVKKPELPEEFDLIAGKRFLIKQAPSVGLLPVFMQAVQNNYTKGTTAVGFRRQSGAAVLDYEEGGETYSLPIGFDRPLLTDVSFQGEPYRLAVSGKMARNEDDIPVLKVKIEFIETPCTRLLKFFIQKDFVTMECIETPGTEFIMRNVWKLAASVSDKPVIGSTLAKVDKDFINYKIEKLFQPRLELEKENGAGS